MFNVVLIMADQLRGDALGCAGNPLGATPAIDALAHVGVRFARHITPNQICSPSRASLFSGLYPRHHGLHRNGVALKETIELISHVLARSGYATYGTGKFHFQPMEAPVEYAMPESWPFWQQEVDRNWRGPFYGFDAVDMVIGESAYSVLGGHYAQWLRTERPAAVDLYSPQHAQEEPATDLDEVWVSAVPAEVHYNTWITNRAVEFIHSQEQNRPFFLFVSYPDPHHPFSPPRPYSDSIDYAIVPMPNAVDGELNLMPDYVRGCLSETNLAVDDPEKSYLDLVLDHGAPREQGFMMRTDGISEATLRRVIAYTYGTIRMIDDGVGQIVDALERCRLRESTIVLFTSDHGEFLGDHGLLHKGPPPYRQLLEVPLVIAGPKFASRTVAALTSHIDLKATLLDATGIAGDPGDGLSLMPLACGETARLRAAVFAEYHPRVAPDQYNQSIITETARLTLYPLRPLWGEFFRHSNDPGEHRNRFADRDCAEEIASLAGRLKKDFPPQPEISSTPIAAY